MPTAHALSRAGPGVTTISAAIPRWARAAPSWTCASAACPRSPCITYAALEGRSRRVSVKRLLTGRAHAEALVHPLILFRRGARAFFHHRIDRRGGRLEAAMADLRRRGKEVQMITAAVRQALGAGEHHGRASLDGEA